MQVSVGPVQLFVEVLGQGLVPTGGDARQGATVIGLHGGPGVDGTRLRHWLAPLADAGQLVVPDLRGHGRSDRGDPADWNLITWADDVHDMCSVLGLDRPVLLGMSFGGFVAQYYAASYPDDICGLILISTAARYPGDEAVLARARRVGGEKAAAALQQLICRPGSDTTAEDQRLLQRLYQRRPDPEAEAMERLTIRTPEVAQTWVPHARQNMDLRAALGAVRCPTLVLVGELDPFNPPDLAAEIIAAIPDGDAQLRVVPDAAHRVFVDNPGFVHSSIRDFLTALG